MNTTRHPLVLMGVFALSACSGPEPISPRQAITELPPGNQGACESGESAAALSCFPKSLKTTVQSATWGNPECKDVDNGGEGPEKQLTCTASGVVHIIQKRGISPASSEDCAELNGYTVGDCSDWEFTGPVDVPTYGDSFEVDDDCFTVKHNKSCAELFGPAADTLALATVEDFTSKPSDSATCCYVDDPPVKEDLQQDRDLAPAS